MHWGKIWGLAIVVLVNHLFWRFMVSSYYNKFISIRRLRKNGLSTKGIIIGHIEQLDNDQMTQYAPVVKFNTQDGVGINIESDDFRMTKKAVGDRVDVSYYSDDPAGAVVNPRSQMWFNLLLVIFLEFVFGAISLGVVIEYLL